MQKTFCDRCGRECVNFHINVHARAVHYTNKGEHLDEEYPLGKDMVQLCRECADALAEFGVNFHLLSEAELLELKRQREADMSGYPEDSEHVPYNRRAHP